MKCRLFFSAILSALLLTGCTKPAPKPAETETSSAAAETVTAPIVTTAETEVSSASETAAESETETDDIVMKPIPSGKQFEVMACEITELPIIKTEQDFL